MSNEDRSDSHFAVLERFVTLPDLLARVEDDRQLLAELFTIFQEEFPDIQDALHRALSSDDLPEAAKAAHALKGMLANLSMKQGALKAAKIEDSAKAGHIVECNQILVDFDSEMSSFLAALALLGAGTGI